MNGSAETIIRLMASFMFDVTKATANLFYLLQGLEQIRSFQTDTVADNGQSTYTLTAPHISHLKVLPTVSVDSIDDLLGPSGETEQLALKGWVDHVYGLWEHHRNELKEHLGEDAIRPLIQCMGDFRNIRNDITHNSGIASRDHSGKCEVLKWFEPPEPVVLTVNHVLDFLNQMNLLQLPWEIPRNGQYAQQFGWRLAPWTTTDNACGESDPKLVSARVSVDADGEDGSERYMVSCAFDDGVFGAGDVEVPVSKELFYKAEIGKDGDLHFPEGQVIMAKALYDACFRYLQGDRREGKGIMGPDMTFRK